MADYYEASTVREKDGKSIWNRIGTMFPNKSGNGFTLVLNALPIGGEDGQVRIVLTLPQPKDDNKPQQSRGGGYGGGRGDPDDSIPFAAEFR